MLRLLPARRLIAACLVIWVLPCLDRQLPAQQKSEVTRARVEALLAIENRSAAIARFKTMGPEVVPALVAILEDAVAEDGESVQRFGGGMGGRHRARTLSDVARMMHPEQRPEALGVPLRFSGQPNRSRRDPDAVLGEWVVPIANDEQFLRSSSLELVAAYALGELQEWAVREMKALAPLVQRADMALCQQLLHSLSKIGAPAVPLLLSVVDKEWGLAGWEALYALHHMGAAAQPGILRYLREVDPKKSSNKHAWLWAMLAKSGDPAQNRSIQHECERWITAPELGIRSFVAEQLAEAWAKKPEQVVERLRATDAYGRLALLEVAVRQEKGLSADTAAALLSLLRDAHRRYAPWMLDNMELKSGDPQALRELGREIALLLPGHPLLHTLILLRLAEKVGSYADPLRPWLMAHRDRCSERLTQQVARCLDALEEEAPEFAAPMHPGFLDAWRASLARSWKDFDKERFDTWYPRLLNPATQAEALREIGKDEVQWAVFLERKLEKAYRVPKAPAVDLGLPELPTALDHSAALRWLDTHRLLPEDPRDLHRALVSAADARGIESPDESRRLAICRALGRFVADEPRNGDWDAHKQFALFDADALELRELNRQLAARFEGEGSPNFVGRLAFPQRNGELMRQIALDLKAHRWPIIRAMSVGHESTRIAVFLTIVAAERMQSSLPKEERLLSLGHSIRDWQPEIRYLTLELLERLPAEHRLRQTMGWSDWVYLARLPQRTSCPLSKARIYRAASAAGTPGWLIVAVTNAELEHPLVRPAALRYLRSLGERAKGSKAKLAKLRKRLIAQSSQDTALLEELDELLRSLP
jgi:hypothetical protein